MDSLHLQPIGTLPDANGAVLVELQYAAPQKVLYVRWFGNLTSREVTLVAQEALKLQGQYPFTLLLNDKTNATGDWVEAMDWLEYEWLPRAMEGGLRSIAYVFSPDMHNQLASMEFFERVRQYIPIQMFQDVPAAWQWLRRQGLPPRTAALPQ
ncbi:STAS/SEC14 domain-containing protein [Hymenobacter endophyticus]|uniref:STAS/SEC14 domain-containing protein n=1 Tax=Hymenobacter endophyticus TaxID=3076335 RepID=A0ABU3TK69_9BACT|nr:STAS/SEC14 domain-containing protein [Hymenobacter endophyticus]MDU0371765.1 STAS/SEC14 domain-containing protein [Hymenobacter endophyticus]